MEQPEDDLGARVRAARSYVKLNQDELGKAVGLKRGVVGAVEDNKERHELTVPEAKRIAQRCGVPVSFLIEGWAAPATLIERVDLLEKLVARVETLEAHIKQVRAVQDRVQKHLDVLDDIVEARLGISVEQALGEEQPPDSSTGHQGEG